MIVVSSGRQGRTEQSVLTLLKNSDLPGIVLMQQKVTDRGRTCEIDAIFIHPRGVLTIEAKHTALAGEVVTFSGLWTVGGVGDPILGDPESQASRQSKIVAAALTSAGTKRSRVRAVICVTGEDAVLAPVKVNADVDAVHITGLLDLIPELLSKTDRYDVADIVAFRDFLNINPTLLTEEMITAEWVKTGASLSIVREEVVPKLKKKKGRNPVPTPYLIGALGLSFIISSQIHPMAPALGGFGLCVLAMIEQIKAIRRRRAKEAR